MRRTQTNIRRALSAWVLATGACLPGIVSAQGGGRTETPHRAEQLSELYGKLSLTRLNITLRETRAEDALTMLQQAVGVTIKARFTVEHKGELVIGMNPDAPITISFQDISALDALEMILDQAVEFEPVTWQLQTGYIEVGTKNRLMNHSERRLYPVRDLLIEPPDMPAPAWAAFFLFGGYGGGGVGVIQSEISAGATANPHGPSSTGNRRPGRLIPRSWGEADQQAIMEELMRVLTETVEPERWEHHDHQPYSTEEQAAFMSGAAEPGEPPREIRKARLDAFDGDTLIVIAPDFMHRQIAGYPAPAGPAAISPDAAAERNAKARMGSSSIEFIGIAAGGGG